MFESVLRGAVADDERVAALGQGRFNEKGLDATDCVGCAVLCVRPVAPVWLCVWLLREIGVNQRQRAFLDAVTHEMRTPLASLTSAPALAVPRGRKAGLITGCGMVWSP